MNRVFSQVSFFFPLVMHYYSNGYMAIIFLFNLLQKVHPLNLCTLFGLLRNHQILSECAEACYNPDSKEAGISSNRIPQTFQGLFSAGLNNAQADNQSTLNLKQGATSCTTDLHDQIYRNLHIQDIAHFLKIQRINKLKKIIKKINSGIY